MLHNTDFKDKSELKGGNNTCWSYEENQCPICCLFITLLLAIMCGFVVALWQVQLAIEKSLEDHRNASPEAAFWSSVGIVVFLGVFCFCGVFSICMAYSMFI